MTFSLPAGPPTSGSSSPSQTKDQQGNLQLGTAIIGAGTGAAWYLGSQQQGNHPSLPLQDQPQQRQPRTQPLQPRPQPPQPRTNRGGGGGGGATGQNARSSSRARVIDKLGSADGYSQWESCMTYYLLAIYPDNDPNVKLAEYMSTITSMTEGGGGGQASQRQQRFTEEELTRLQSLEDDCVDDFRSTDGTEVTTTDENGSTQQQQHQDETGLNEFVDHAASGILTGAGGLMLAVPLWNAQRDKTTTTMMMQGGT